MAECGMGFRGYGISNPAALQLLGLTTAGTEKH